MSLKCYSYTAYFSKSYLAKVVNLNQLVMWLQKDKKRKTENMNLNKGCSYKLQTQKAKLKLQH